MLGRPSGQHRGTQINYGGVKSQGGLPAEQGSGWARRQSLMLTALGRGWKVPRLPCGCSITVRSCPSIRPQLGVRRRGLLKGSKWGWHCGQGDVAFRPNEDTHCGTVMCQLVCAGS